MEKKWEAPIVGVYITPEQLAEINRRHAEIESISSPNEVTIAIRVEGKIGYHDYQKLTTP